MKFIFKILLLIVSCCYLNTIFELSDKETKTNFENEVHTYLHQEEQNINFDCTKTIKKINPEIVIVEQKDVAFKLNIDPEKLFVSNPSSSPPQRKYILYESLVI